MPAKKATATKKSTPKKKSTPAKVAKDPTPTEIVSSIVTQGDISALSQEDKLKYYYHLCKSFGLNPAVKPFDIIKFPNGRELMYCNRAGAEQLRAVHGISVVETKQSFFEGLCMTTAVVQDAHGRTDSDVGAVPIAGLKGDALANAIKKSATQAKRRATLSITGLGVLDETEVEQIPNVAKVEIEAPAKPDDGYEEKLQALPDYVKDGFRALGWKRKAVILFCENWDWNNDRIREELDKMANGDGHES